MDERDLADRLDRALDGLAQNKEVRDAAVDPATIAIARGYLVLGRAPAPAKARAGMRRRLAGEEARMEDAWPGETRVVSLNGNRSSATRPLEPSNRRGRAALELAAAILLVLAVTAGPFDAGQALNRLRVRWGAAPVVDLDVTTYGGDAARTGEMPGPGPTNMPVERWRAPLPGAGATVGRSAPLVAGGLVIVAQPNGVVTAFDGARGGQRWRWQPSEPLRFVAAPVVDGQALFVGAQDGTFVALDLATGTERWRIALGASPGAPAVVGGTIYVGLDSVPAVAGGLVYVTGRCACNAVVALDARTGAERWRFNGTDGYLFALDAKTGEERWRHDPQGETLADPAVAGGVIYTVTSSGTAVALDAETGGERWRQAIPGATGQGSFDATPAIGHGTVFVSSRTGNVTALDAKRGAVEWQDTLSGSVIASPTVANGTVYIGDLNGTLSALAQTDGALLWSTKLTGLIGGPAVVTDGAVYVLTGDGALVSLADAG